MQASRKVRAYGLVFSFILLLILWPASLAADNVYFGLQLSGVHFPGKKIPLHINGQGIRYLDFRIYRVQNPVAFFNGLKNAHSFGTYKDQYRRGEPTLGKNLMEKVRDLRRDWLDNIRDYLRRRLHPETRRWLRQLIMGKAEAQRTEVQVLPLVPYLNKEMLVKSWRESFAKKPRDWYYYTTTFTLPQPGVYVIEAVYEKEQAYSVAVVSNLALLFKEGAKSNLLYCLDRRSGEPRGEVKLAFYQKGQLLKSAQSGADGYASFAGLEGQGGYLFAQKGKDFAFLDLRERNYFPYTYKAYIYTERPVYRPGQKVFYKALARKDEEGRYQIDLPAGSRVEIKDGSGRVIQQTEKKWNRFGALSGEFTLPQELSLGNYQVVVTLEGQNFSGNFRVEEYKKPEFEVKVTLDKKNYVLGDTIKAKMAAKYYFGSPVVEATVHYNVYNKRYYYPWWGETEYGWFDEGEDEGYYGWGRKMVSEQTGTLDANGELTVSVDTDKDLGQDCQYIIEARVTDKSRREISAAASAIVTRGEFILRLETDRYVYKPGEMAKVKAKAQDLEGKPVKTKVVFSLVKEVEPKQETIQQKTVTTDAQGIAYWELPITQEGYLRIVAEAQDTRGNKITEKQYLWVSSLYARDWGWRGGLEIIPDKKSYKPGEVAQVLIIAPEAGNYLVLTVEREGVFFKDMIKMEGSTLLYKLPIKEKYSPNAFLSAYIFKNGSYMAADKVLLVPPTGKFLKVTVLPQKAIYRPNETGEVTVLVQDGKGLPMANTELSLGVVDESIYAIVPELAPDIKKFFYDRRWNQTSTHNSNNFYFSGYSGKDKITLAQKSGRSKAFADIKGETYQEARVRREFRDTALWVAHVVTDGRGQARVKIPFPDNLTTWRATARAITLDTKVGSATAKTITRKDLILRLEVPRFMRDRDELTVSGLVHNYLSREKRTKVTLEVKGARLLNPAEQIITLGKNAEARIDWKLKATQPGQAVLLAKALTDEESDAVELTVPVLPHGVEQRIALTGELASPAAQEKKSESFVLPPEMVAGTENLKIVLSPSLASTVLPALDYLVGYPYGCVEQTMSRFFPTLVTVKAMNQLGFEYKKSKEIPKMVKEGQERLYSQQNTGGGWGWWSYDESNPEMTAYVLEGLWASQQLGYGADRGVITKGRRALADLIQQSKAEEHLAYGLYILQKTGGLDKQAQTALEGLYGKHPALSPKDTAYLLMTFAELGNKEKTKILMQNLENKAKKINGHVYWGAAGKDPWDDQRVATTALVLQAYLRMDPQNKKIPQIARWLALNRHDGYWWESTKTTAKVILSLVDYLKVSQELWPNYNLKVELNGRLLTQNRITRKEVNDTEGLTFTLKDLKPGKNVVTMERDGPGILYYTLLAKYFTQEENIAAKDYKNLRVRREYFLLNPVGGEKRITYVKDSLPSAVKSGSDIFVKLTVDSDQPLSYFMLEDYIPAGCEIIEKVERFQISEENYYEDFGWHWWYAGREARDNRMAFFATYLPKGKSTFTYILKAQIPGVYHVMPLEGSLMYFPQVRAIGKEYMIKIVD